MALIDSKNGTKQMLPELVFQEENSSYDKKEIDEISKKNFSALNHKYDVKSPLVFSINVKRKEKNFCDEAQKIYQDIIKKYEINSKNEALISSEINIEVGITSSNLMKIIKKSLSILSKKNKCNEISLCEWKSWSLMIYRENGRLFILKWSGKKYLEEGNCYLINSSEKSVVQKVYDLTNARILALKISLETESVAVGSSLNLMNGEVQKLQKIHETGRIKGIQPPPIKFLEIKDGDQSLYGSLNHFFNLRDAFVSIQDHLFRNMPKRQILLIFQELLEALAYLHKEDKKYGCIIHGDINPNNIFCKRNKKGKLKAVIGDLDGAKFVDTELNLENKQSIQLPPFGTYYTLLYYTYSDLYLLSKLYESKNQNEWIECQKKRDVFALVKTFWLMVTEYDLTYDPIEMAFEVKKPVVNYSIVEEKCGKSVADIFRKTLTKMTLNRPSINELLEVIRAEIQKENI